MVPGECFPPLGNPKLCPVQDCAGSKPAAWGCNESTCWRNHLCNPPSLSEGGCIPTRAVRTWPEWPSQGWRWVCFSLGLLRAAVPCHVWGVTPQVQRETCASPSPDDLGSRSWLWPGRGGGGIWDRAHPLPPLPISHPTGSFMLTLYPLRKSGGSSEMYIPTCMLQICHFPPRSVKLSWRGRKNKERSKQTERQKPKKHFLSAGCWLYLELWLVYVCIQSKFSEEYPAVISQRVWTNSLTAPLLEW